jgi:hypothetical protein
MQMVLKDARPGDKVRLFTSADGQITCCKFHANGQTFATVREQAGYSTVLDLENGNVDSIDNGYECEIITPAIEQTKQEKKQYPKPTHTLRDAKIGDRVLVYPNATGGVRSFISDSNVVYDTKPIEATVVATIQNTVYLGWKGNEHPIAMAKSDHRIGSGYTKTFGPIIDTSPCILLPEKQPEAPMSIPKPTGRLSQYNVGDEVEIYIDQEGMMVELSTNAQRTSKAKIIAKNKNGSVDLAWKTYATAPKQAGPTFGEYCFHNVWDGCECVEVALLAPSLKPIIPSPTHKLGDAKVGDRVSLYISAGRDPRASSTNQSIVGMIDCTVIGFECDVIVLGWKCDEKTIANVVMESDISGGFVKVARYIKSFANDWDCIIHPDKAKLDVKKPEKKELPKPTGKLADYANTWADKIDESAKHIETLEASQKLLAETVMLQAKDILALKEKLLQAEKTKPAETKKARCFEGTCQLDAGHEGKHKMIDINIANTVPIARLPVGTEVMVYVDGDVLSSKLTATMTPARIVGKSKDGVSSIYIGWKNSSDTPTVCYTSNSISNAIARGSGTYDYIPDIDDYPYTYVFSKANEYLCVPIKDKPVEPEQKIGVQEIQEAIEVKEAEHLASLPLGQLLELEDPPAQAPADSAKEEGSVLGSAMMVGLAAVGGLLGAALNTSHSAARIATGQGYSEEPEQSEQQEATL